MRKLLALVFISFLTCLASDICWAQFSKLSFGGYGVSSIRPESFSAVNGAVWIDVTNSMEGFNISEISALVYKNGRAFVTGSANDVYVPSGSSKVTITGRAALCTGSSLWDVLALLAFNPADYSVDLSVRITLDSGETRVVSQKNLPVSVLLKLI